MLGNYLIGLREGLEAAIVVSVLLAYLVRTGRTERRPYVWAGVGAAVLLSAGAAAMLQLTSASLSSRAQEVFAGTMSLLAVALVTGMVFWMRRASRSIAGELRGRLDAALAVGGFAVVAMAFVAVAREGLETALFLWSAAQATGTTALPLLAFLLGLGTAVALGAAMYRGALRIDLRSFFRWTGAFLVLVAAGVLTHGVHELQEAGVLPGLDAVLFDVRAQVPPGSWYGTTLSGVLGFSARTTFLEAAAWLLYVVPTLVLFLRPLRSAAERPAPVTAGASTPA